MSDLDTRREHYGTDALRRAEQADRKAVLELAARARIEYARLMLEVTPKTTRTAVAAQVARTHD